MKLFRSEAAEASASLLYEAIVGQARRPEFYRGLGVPDTIQGRFEMIALHAFLVLRQLRADGPGAARLAQALFDLMFADFDRSFRELGAGDLGVGRRVKTLAKAFYGRLVAYGAGLDGLPSPERPAFADLPPPAEAGFAKAGAKALRLRAGRSPGFAQAGGDLDDALRRNLYGGVAADQGQLAAMAAYLRREAGAIAAQDGAARLAGAIAFGAPPVVAEAVP